MQARADILAAAEREFARRGYAGATSRDLAGAAGVSESLIYRHFGSKSGLFAAAVLAPFQGFLETFSETSARYLAQPLPVEAMLRLFVSELFDQLTVHRGALRSFLAAVDDLDPATTGDFYRAFDEVMVRISEVADTEARVRQRRSRGLGSEINARMVVGLVLSLVVLDDLLLPADDRRPGRDQLIEHICTILRNGI